MPSQGSQSLLHAPNTDATLRRTILHVKAPSPISNRQMECLFHAFQTNLSAVCSAMPFDVSQCFLGDAKKTERRVRGNAMRNVLVRKVDLYSLLLRELLAEGVHSCNQSQTLQRGRMQAYATDVQVGGDLADIIPELVELLAACVRRLPNLLS